MACPKILFIGFFFVHSIFGAQKQNANDPIKECEKDCQKAFEAIAKDTSKLEQVWKLYQQCIAACNMPGDIKISKSCPVKDTAKADANK